MLKNKLKGLVSGVIIMSLVFFGVMAFAASTSKTIQVSSNVSVYVDDMDLKLIEGNENIEPFIYNGSTYLPLKAISTALGKDVTWDDKNRSVYIGEKSSVPYVNIALNQSQIKEGGTLSLTVTYLGNISTIQLSKSMVVLNGFTADISISGTKNTRNIILSNIQNNPGEKLTNKFVTIAEGTATSGNGHTANKSASLSFEILPLTQNDTTKPVVIISNPNVASVNAGGTVIYNVDAIDLKHVAVFDPKNLVKLNGFTATIDITEIGNAKTIVLSNIQGTAGEKTITIGNGAAINSDNNHSDEITSMAFTLNDTDHIKPVVTILNPNPVSVQAGGTVTYAVTYADNVEVPVAHLNSGTVKLNGFTANKSVLGSGNTKIVTLSNIQGSAGQKSFTVIDGAAMDSSGNLSDAVTSLTFTLMEDSNKK